VSAAFRFDGLAEQLAQWQQLAHDMAREAQPSVEDAGRQAVATIRAGYPKRTGDLRDHVTMIATQTGDRVQVVVINTSPHAAVFERGSQARHTKIGADRGSMPANPLFTAELIRRRRELLGTPIPAVLRAFGLEVRGG
jgi:bacteriophage HK97-gp10 putative tail-component